MSDPVATLNVWMNDTLLGTLYNENPLTFIYDPAWLASSAARALNPEIELQAGKISTPFVHAFFENLLPEGDQRKLLSLREHVNSVFGLLSAVGGDTAGSIVLLLCRNGFS